MDLFKDIFKGKKFTPNKLKREAKHELKELGGMGKAEKYEKALKRVRGATGRGKSHMSGKHYKHDIE
jgi:hypothetical protein